MTRTARDKLLLKHIQLWAEVAESNPRKAQDQIGRILRAAIQLSRGQPVNEDKRKRLVHLLAESTIGETGSIEPDGNRLFINEEFDCRELAKRIIW